MSARPPTRKDPLTNAAKRRGGDSVASDRPGSLHWVKDVLGRSIRFEERRNQTHIVLVDRRRPQEQDTPQSLLLQMRAELRTRLLVYDPATQVVRNLVFVHEELARSGWAGVEGLPRGVVAKAQTEAEILDTQDSTPMMKLIIEQLREIGAAADARAEHQRAQKEAMLKEWETPRVAETYEATHEEYEQLERSWVGTVPDGLDLSDRADHAG